MNLPLSMADGLVPDWDFTSFPCHTVAVEGTVRLVTDVSRQGIGPEARDRQIRATILSRKTVNVFDTKKDFVGVINDSETLISTFYIWLVGWVGRG